eukprot:984532-Pleurochrysis_carterae.AAC.1
MSASVQANMCMNWHGREQSVNSSVRHKRVHPLASSLDLHGNRFSRFIFHWPIWQVKSSALRTDLALKLHALDESLVSSDELEQGITKLKYQQARAPSLAI